MGKEFYKFTFPATDSESVQASLDYIACQAQGGNNNLERFHARLVNEGRISQAKYSKFRGTMISSNTEPSKWNDIKEGSYVRRVCKSCYRDNHKDIIYKRLTGEGTINFKNLFLANWFSNPQGDG